MSEELTKAPAASLSLRRLHELLNLRGVEVSYSTLSEFVGYGDIAEQLHVGGGANRREFPADTVDVLVNFWPLFRESGGRKPNAPSLLRRFLASGSGVSVTGKLNHAGDGLEVLGTPKLIEAREQGRAQGLAAQDRPMTAQDAADYLSVTVPMLRRTVKPSFRIGKSPRGDRWLLSRLLDPITYAEGSLAVTKTSELKV